MPKNRDRAEMVVRMPQDVKAWLETEAARTGASQNSEIVRSLRDRMEREPAKAAG
jgi:predicted HicB family RNase H-like nuclease